MQRSGEDYAVIISAREWHRQRRREKSVRSAVARAGGGEASIEEIGRRLDALGPDYRFSADKQARIEELLETEKTVSHADRAEGTRGSGGSR